MKKMIPHNIWYSLVQEWRFEEAGDAKGKSFAAMALEQIALLTKM
jgi:hypothetical protein